MITMIRILIIHGYMSKLAHHRLHEEARQDPPHNNDNDNNNNDNNDNTCIHVYICV